MTIQQIKDLNYNNNKELFQQELIKFLKLQTMPNEIGLRRYAEKLQRKFPYKVHMILFGPDSFTAVVRVGDRSYSNIECKEYKEFLIKYILFVKAWYKLDKEAQE